MAQLNDLLVAGGSNFLGEASFLDVVKLSKLNLPTEAGGATFGPGSNGQVLKSNGSTVYWGTDSNPTLSSLGGIGTITATGTSPLTLTATKTGTSVAITGSVDLSITRSLTSGTKIATIKLGTTNYDLYCETNTDTNNKVAQTTAAASGYTNWRPLIIGSSNSSTEGFTPTSVTDQVYAFSTISAQPSSGTIRASIFKGNLTGNVTGNVSGTAGALTNLTDSDKASSSTTQRRVWFCYSDNVTGRPAYDDNFTYQTSTGTLTAKVFNGNATSATKATQDTNGNPIHTTYLKLSGGTLSGKLWLGGSTQDSAVATGIGIQDIRNVTVTPKTFGEKAVNFYFDQEVDGGWKSIIHMHGWTDDYAAWQLAGNATSSTSNNSSLYFRTGIKEEWQPWHTVLDNVNTSFTQVLTSGTKIGTIKINGTSTDIYCETNTNTDTKVTQSETTTSNFRPLILGAVNNSSASKLNESTTGQVYVTTKMYAQPSTGTLYATKFVGNLTGNVSGTSGGFNDTVHYVELNKGGTLASYGGFIDFHYHNASKQPTDASGTVVDATPDYTTRIVENAAGQLAITSSLGYITIKGSTITGNLAGTATRATQDGDGYAISSTYLKRSGGTMTGPIKNATLTSTWVAACNGDSLINSSKTPGDFSPMMSGGTTNGRMTVAFYRTGLQATYITKANCDSNTNTVGATATLMDEGGNGIWPGNVTAAKFIGPLNGNADTATKLKTARTIFGKSFDGSANVAGQALVYGTYTSTAANRYSSGGLQIRENGCVGNAQTDIGYAPAIGFHWANRKGGTLLFHHDGIFYFRAQDFTSRATIDANVIGDIAGTADQAKSLSSGTAYSDNNSTNRYFKVATITKPNTGHVSGAATFLVNSYYTTTQMHGMVRVSYRADYDSTNKVVTVSTNRTFMKWMSRDSGITLDNFILTYIQDTTNKTITFNIYVKLPSTYQIVKFTKLSEQGFSTDELKWTMLNGQGTGTNTFAEIPSGETQILSTDGNLATKNFTTSGTAAITGNVTMSSAASIAGNTTIAGTLTLTKTTDADPSASKVPALIVGGTSSTAHIEMDCNEIFAKGSDGAAETDLYLGYNSAKIHIGQSTKGSTTKPVYLYGGVITECNTYAGGTKVKLNGVDKGSSTADFYAPTSAGTTSQVLIGSGSSTAAPTWTSTLPNAVLPLRLQNYSTSGFADANSATEQGFHYITATTNGPTFNTDAADYRILTTAYSTSWLQQIATNFRTNELFLRRKENNSWKPWVRIHTQETGLSLDGSNEMTGNLVFACGDSDRYIHFKYASSTGYDWRLGYKGSGDGNANYFVIESDKNTGTWTQAMRIGLIDHDVTFSGSVSASSFLGNATSATKANTIYTTNTNPTSAGSYFLTYVSSTTDGYQNARVNPDLYYYEDGTGKSWLNVGTKSHQGSLTLHSGNGTTDKYVNLTYVDATDSLDFIFM